MRDSTKLKFWKRKEEYFICALKEVKKTNLQKRCALITAALIRRSIKKEKKKFFLLIIGL